ncbi:UDP-galactose transporter [Podila horticola]|nr:UDP-galactose transporter [Podila horticola]
MSFLNLKVQGKSIERPSKPLIDKYMQVAFLSVIASPFSYAALKHIDYPTIILTESCKLIPVMFMSILLYRRRFPPTIVLVIINLTLDGVTNSTQDQIFNAFNVSGQQMMCVTSLFMSGFMALWLLLNPWLMIGVVFSGIGLEAYVKRSEKLTKMREHKKEKTTEKEVVSETVRATRSSTH